MNAGNSDFVEPGRDAAAELRWWFSLATGLVELGVQSKALDRIGPFATEEQAKNALEIVRLRNARWNEDEGDD